MAGACAAAILGNAPARADGLALSGVAAGQVGIATPNASTTTITQTTDKALINWQSFSIGAGSTVQFVQPGASSITLNRVVGTGASIVNGNLTANGQVWLINGNGVLFGANAQVNVGGLIATTADMRDADFLSGNYSFSKPSANPNAGVENRGAIRTRRGGSAVLAGASVSNQGLIQADFGKVVLAGGSTFGVDFSGDNLLRFAVTAPAHAAPQNDDGSAKTALVSNSGTISAQGGRVVMTARAASNVVDHVINSSGIVQAVSAIEIDGAIILDGGEDGGVRVAGTLDASGAAPGATGGRIEILGRDVRIEDGAALDASGDAGGGTILIGGNLRGLSPQPIAATTRVGAATIEADATATGDGGTIAVWSDGSTSFAGSASAKGGGAGGNGGTVETSGHRLEVSAAASVDTSAASGVTGTWLLDPDNIVIKVGGNTPLPPSGTLAAGDHPGLTDFVDPATIVAALATTNVMLQAVQDINVFSNVVYSSPNSLSLLAGHNVNFNADVQNQQPAGGGAIYAIGGWDGVTTNLASLTNFGVFGNGTGNVRVGFATGNFAVGSLSGSTIVAGRSVIVDSLNGNAQIGYRGAGKGDISVSAVLDVTVNQPSALAQALIGNGGTAAAAGSTGNVTIDAGTINGFAASATNDLAGGNVTLRTYSLSPFVVDKPIVYNSANFFAVLSAGDISLANSIQNHGTGFVSLVAGRDKTTLSPIAVFSSTTAYGNNNGTIVVGGTAAPGNVAAGSAGGALNIAAKSVVLDAQNGYAQLGFHGGGGGAISIIAKDNLSLQAQGTNAARFAQVGNGSVAHDVTGNITGDMFLRIGGPIAFFNHNSGPGAFGWIGNVAGSGFASGNLTIRTANIQDNGSANFGNMIRDALGTTAVAGSGGNIILGVTNPTDPGGITIDDATNFASLNTPHSLAVASGLDLTLAGPIQNAGSGALTFVAGWDGITENPANLTNPGAFGNNNGAIIVGGNAALGDVAIGSASGPSVFAAKNITLDAQNGYAQLGFHGSGGGTISVLAKDSLVLNAQSTHAGRFAQVGNGSADHSVAGPITGEIVIRAGGPIKFFDQLSRSGGFGRIGNIAGSGISSGNLTIIAADIEDNGIAEFGNMLMAALGTTAAPGSGGEVFNGLTAPAGGFTIDQNVLIDTPHTITLASTGDLVLGSLFQNAGNGAMTFVAGWDGVTTILANLSNPAAFGQNGGGIVVGGALAPRNAAVGSLGGTTTLLGKTLTLDAVNGYAQIGYRGAAGGRIAVTAVDDVLLKAGAVDGRFAQIGHGGLLISGTMTGNIAISAGGDVGLAGSAGANSYAQIGHGGAQSNAHSAGYTLNGDITVNGADVKLESGSGTASYTQIGHGGDNSGNNLTSGTGTIAGTIVVTASGEVFLLGGGNSAYAQIGHGGSFVNAGTVLAPANLTITGNVSVSDLTVTGGTGNAAYALIGNGALGPGGIGTISGDVTIAALGNILLTPGVGVFAGANIGNFIGTGTATGTITGYVPPPPPPPPVVAPTVDATTIGTLVTLTAPNMPPPGAPNNFAPAPPPANTGGAPLMQQIVMAMQQGGPPGPIEDLKGNDGANDEQTVADNLSQTVADSVTAPKPSNRVTIIDGLLQQLLAPATINPTGVPPADEQFSSWGNEALWQP